MHYDLETTRGFSEFMKSLNLSPLQIQNLFKETINLLERMRVHYGFKKEIVPLFLHVEQKAEEDMDYILKKLK